MPEATDMSTHNLSTSNNSTHPSTVSDDTIQRRRAWAYLNYVFDGPHQYLNSLWAIDPTIDPRDVADRIIARDTSLGSKLLSATESRCHSANPDQDLALAARAGARLVTRDDPEWPADALKEAFEPLASAEGAKSQQRDSCPPTCLWVRGEDLRMTTRRAVTIVGTRSASSYGRTVTQQLTTELVGRGYSIISGGALGIDSAAHHAAIHAGGTTVGILACGVDVPYPAAHKQLFRDIIHSGSLISEYPPGRRPARHRFLTRNRLAAAFGAATVVVEAGFRSGALNTASWSEHMNRPVLAVPGSVLSRESCGCHRLIREGRAILVERTEDIIEALSTVGETDAEYTLELQYPKRPSQGLNMDQLRVYDATDPTGNDVMSICTKAALPLDATMRILFELTELSLVERSGQHYRRKA